MNTKKTILIFIDWFFPGFLAGGPIQSIASLVENLRTDFHLKIITGNTDLDNIPYTNIKTDTWILYKDGAEIFYMDRQTITSAKISAALRDLKFDIVYINSFFSKNFSIVPLSILKKQFPLKPVLFAPRGMLGAGALQIKKMKKLLFIYYSKISGLHNRVLWHATSKEEEAEIRSVYGKRVDVVTLPNIPKAFSADPKRLQGNDRLQVCFISRINEKKNLVAALESLRKCAKEVVFEIYGPLEDAEYWARCEKVINLLPANIKASYKGILSPTQIESVYKRQDVLLLPTLNENFGHSIVESLMCGCPVIISDQTPWGDLRENRAGFALPLNDLQAFTNAVEYYATLSPDEYLVESGNAINYIRKKIDLEKIIDQYKNLLNDTIKNRSV